MWWDRKPREDAAQPDPLRETLRQVTPILETFVTAPGVGPFATANGSALVYSDGLPCYFLVTQGADRIVRRIQITPLLDNEAEVTIEVRALALLTLHEGVPVTRAEATEFRQRNEVIATVPPTDADLTPALHTAWDTLQSWGADDLAEGIAVA